MFPSECLSGVSRLSASRSLLSDGFDKGDWRECGDSYFSGTAWQKRGILLEEMASGLLYK